MTRQATVTEENVSDFSSIMFEKNVLFDRERNSRENRNKTKYEEIGLVLNNTTTDRTTSIQQKLLSPI